MKQRARTTKEQLSNVLRQKEAADITIGHLAFFVMLLSGLFFIMAAACVKKDAGQFNLEVITILTMGAGIIICALVMLFLVERSPVYKCEECGYEHQTYDPGEIINFRRGRNQMHCTMCNEKKPHTKVSENKEQEVQ